MPTGDLLKAIQHAAATYRKRHALPPQPAVVPRWVVDEYGPEVIDAEARAYGFDGFELLDEEW